MSMRDTVMASCLSLFLSRRDYTPTAHYKRISVQGSCATTDTYSQSLIKHGPPYSPPKKSEMHK